MGGNGRRRWVAAMVVVVVVVRAPDVRRGPVVGCDEGNAPAKKLVRSCVGEKGLGLGCCHGGGHGPGGGDGRGGGG